MFAPDRGPSLQDFPGGFFCWPGQSLRGPSPIKRKGHPHGVSRISPERLNRYLALRDLTDPDQGRHAINILMQDVISAVARWSRLAADLLIVQQGGRRFTWGSANLQASSDVRRAYIDALKAADEHDPGPLVAFVRS